MNNPEILTEKIVETRKPHTCDWCGEKIPTGDTACYRGDVCCGRWRNIYHHVDCWVAMTESEDDHLREHVFADLPCPSPGGCLAGDDEDDDVQELDFSH